MTFDELLKPVPELFFEKSGKPEDADILLFSAPLDRTTSYRGGSRFAPTAIREASQYMESYSVRTGLDWDDLSLADIGDIVEAGEVEPAVENIRRVVEEIAALGKLPAMLGGEHTITLGALRALRPAAVVVFDAHLDLRDTLFDERLCHATYLRRAHEEQGFKLVIVAARALSAEEIEYANEKGITIITAQDVKRFGVEPVLEMIKDTLEGAESVYLSVDMDAVDPAEAPAVGNPSPEGITVTQLLDLTAGIVDRRLVGFDLNEVSPSYDSGLTAIQAAYIVLEALYLAGRARRVPPS
ncbi:MAG: agmatinase [Candidatus Bathyarchaeota archaeon]|nr:agmatinase [Candidatus Bathyarchaeota archaeon]